MGQLWYLMVDRTRKAIAIEIGHGTAMVFDGREIRHCTSMTKARKGNKTHGIFLGAMTQENNQSKKKRRFKG